MTLETSSTLLYFLTKELQVLEGGKENIIFRVYQDKQKYNFRVHAPEFISITKQEYDTPKTPPGFCMFLRKYLTNARIERVEQKDFERILQITFTTKTEKYYLIIELFKPGNVILCKMQENQLIVMNSFERQSFKDRVIHARKPYEYPPSLNNPQTLTHKELIEIVNKSDRNLVKTITSKLGLGGIYAEEIIARTKLEKSIDEIDEKKADEIIKAINDFFREEIKPQIIKDKIIPVNMITQRGDEQKSLSDAIDSLTPINLKEKTEKKQKKTKSKTETLVEIQKKMIKDLEKKAEENQAKGEFIYTNYQEFKQLLTWANTIKTKNGLDALEAELKKNKKYKSINKKEKEITFKF